MCKRPLSVGASYAVQVSPDASERRHERLPASDALDRIRAWSEDLVSGRVTPYDAGSEMWGLAMGSVGPGTDGEHCHALWLVWGALTDWVEVKPDEEVAAQAAMRRAAAEWLDAREDETAWRAYFDRWLYEELGYERPGA